MARFFDDFVFAYLEITKILEEQKENCDKGKLHYYRFISYSDGSGYCHGLRIKCMTKERAEHMKKCGIIYELMA